MYLPWKHLGDFCGMLRNDQTWLFFFFLKSAHSFLIQVLLVFTKEDNQCNGFCRACEKAGFKCTVTKEAQAVLACFLDKHHDIIISHLDLVFHITASERPSWTLIQNSTLFSLHHISPCSVEILSVLFSIGCRMPRKPVSIPWVPNKDWSSGWMLLSRFSVLFPLNIVRVSWF